MFLDFLDKKTAYLLVVAFSSVNKEFLAENKSRIDIFLAKQMKNDCSRVEVQNFIKNGNVKVNGKEILKCSFDVLIGDKIEVCCEIKKKETELQPKEMDIEIVFENENLLIIDKPKGLTTHPGAGNRDDTLVNGLLALEKSGRITLSNERGSERLGIVHRLDKDTSGLMIVAKNNKAHRLLGELLKTHEIDRRYLALVHGVPVPPIGKIENFICRDKKNIQRMKICQEDEIGAKKAITNYKVLKVVENSKYSLVECKLETGRTHQIRLHMFSIGHSLVGEQIYTKANFKNDDKQKGFFTQMLHSYKLSFYDPVNGEKIELERIGDGFKQFFNNIVVK